MRRRRSLAARLTALRGIVFLGTVSWGAVFRGTVFRGTVFVRAALVLAVMGLAPTLIAAADASGRLHVVIVGGIGGEPRYVREIEQATQALADLFRPAVTRSDAVVRLVGDAATLPALERQLTRLRGQLRKQDRVLLCLVGHGSADGSIYKFNLRGVDLAAPELARWLDALPTRDQLVVSTTSSSGAMLEALEAPGRIVVTATRSGAERNATVFGELWVRALRDRATDLDRDGWITADEAFTRTADFVEEHYTRLRRLRTEHARLAGAAAAKFRLVAVRAADSSQASLRPDSEARRVELLAKIDALRARKAELDETEYLNQLESLLIPLAELLVPPPAGEGSP